MLLSTQDHFEDREISVTLGRVRGNTIRARHVGKDIMAALRNVVGGEVLEYTKMMAEAREQALDRMLARAEELGGRRGGGHQVHQRQRHERGRGNCGLRHGRPA